MLSTRQRSIIKKLRAGAIITKQGKYKARLLDDQRNPLQYVHGKTFNALYRKSLIKQQPDGSYAVVLNK